MHKSSDKPFPALSLTVPSGHGRQLALIAFPKNPGLQTHVFDSFPVVMLLMGHTVHARESATDVYELAGQERQDEPLAPKNPCAQTHIVDPDDAVVVPVSHAMQAEAKPDKGLKYDIGQAVHLLEELS